MPTDAEKYHGIFELSFLREYGHLKFLGNGHSPSLGSSFGLFEVRLLAELLGGQFEVRLLAELLGTVLPNPREEIVMSRIILEWQDATLVGHSAGEALLRQYAK
jgi:hypothetical protein